MRYRGIAAIVVALTVVMTGCSSGSSPEYERYLRKFTPADANLIGVDGDRAASIQAKGNVLVAVSDIRVTPVCDGHDKFIIVAKQPGIGQWLGGDLGCRSMELSIAGELNEMVFNPFCQWADFNIEGQQCLKLVGRRTTTGEMMSKLRPATRAEITLAQKPDPTDDASADPSEQELSRTFTVKEEAYSQPLLIAPLYGAEAITIIVPTGVKLGGGQIGHNQLYVGGDGKYGDPLCQAAKKYGLAVLPIKFSGPELDYVTACTG